MNIKTDKILNGYILVTIIYIFFAHLAIFSKYININITYLGISIVFFLYMLVINYKKITLDKFDFLFIIFIGYLIILSTILGWNSYSIEYFAFFTVIGLVALSLKSDNCWHTFIIKAILICTLIHSIFIVMQAILPDFVLKLDKLILRSNTFELVITSQNYNYYCGIAPGAASAGLFSTILVGIAVSKMLTDKKIKPTNLILLIVGLVALLLSQKRVFLIASIVAIFIIMFVLGQQQKSLKKSIKRFFIFGIIVMLFVIILMFIPETQNVIDRFVDNDRMLSGRESMYEQMLTWFKESPILGAGLGTAESQFGYGGHNIYLQMLSECGVIGATIYFLYLFGTAITNINIVIKEEIIDYKMLFLIFMQIILILYGITGNPIYDYSYLVLFSYLLVIPRGMKREINNVEESKCYNTYI